MHNGRPLGSYSNTFISGRHSPAPALQRIPSNSLRISPALRTPTSPSLFGNLLAEASAAGVAFGSSSFSQGSHQTGFSRVFNQPAFLSPAPLGYTSAIGNDLASFQYDQTTHRLFKASARHLSPPPAALPNSSSMVDESHPCFAAPISPQALTGSEVPPPPERCAWCDDQQPRACCESWDEFYVHYHTAHPSAESWKPRKCLWWGCDNGVTYATRNSWLQHVPRKHQKTVYCDHDDCEFGGGGKALGTQQDKKRHIQDIHDPAIHCQLEYCTHTKRRLNRADHKKMHMIKYHGSFCCQALGCERGQIDGNNYGFSTAAELQLHMNKRRHTPAESQWSADD
ncbi:hypothetical protein EG329_002647 [Mollisiaceae sp. DMI_Dod_QoI]|nr:hypothetical protein EG329_002647 [Helotiales sp. DMI_Dod_QoI]